MFGCWSQNQRHLSAVMLFHETAVSTQTVKECPTRTSAQLHLEPIFPMERSERSALLVRDPAPIHLAWDARLNFGKISTMDVPLCALELHGCHRTINARPTQPLVPKTRVGAVPYPRRLRLRNQHHHLVSRPVQMPFLSILARVPPLLRLTRGHRGGAAHRIPNSAVVRPC